MWSGHQVSRTLTWATRSQFQGHASRAGLANLATSHRGPRSDLSGALTAVACIRGWAGNSLSIHACTSCSSARAYDTSIRREDGEPLTLLALVARGAGEQGGQYVPPGSRCPDTPIRSGI